MADTEIPDDHRYSSDDEWVRAEDGRSVVGITDFAQQQLGDVVFVELPEVGKQIAKGETFGVIESVKAVSDLYSPISGEVTEVNDMLTDSPEIVNASCYEDGWLIALQPSDPSELDELMNAAAYRESVAERSE